jgi:signal peptidase I
MSDRVQQISLPRPTLHRPGFLREILETLVLIGAIYALVNLATVRFFVDGPSMQPTFHTEQRIIVSRVNYLIGRPARGDIVVFDSPEADPDDPPLIKRVIGLPGETVEIRDRQVYVDGKQLNESYINEPCSESRCRDNTWQLGTDQYFVMGDNRNHSNDSRAFGPVSWDRFIGEALVRYWPPSDWGLIIHSRFPDNPFDAQSAP